MWPARDNVDIAGLSEKCGVKEEAVAAALAALKAEWGWKLRPFRDDRDVMTALTLLYAKPPPQLFELMPAVRVGMIADLLSRRDDDGKNAKRKGRLLRLVTVAHDKGSAVPPDSVAMFFTVIPEWSSSATSTVFFRDVVPNSDVYRVQLEGNCFMHAPDAVAHYVMCKNNPSDKSALKEMADLTAYVLQYWGGGLIWDYVYHDLGGVSTDFLLQLTGLTAGQVEGADLSSTRVSADAVVERFTKYGPALVARFDSFKGMSKNVSHVGANSIHSTEPEVHAMALVGWRKRADGKTLFLIQNWRKDFQFFECDIEFLRSRRASLVWITDNKLTKLPQGVPRTFSITEECSLEGRERAPYERA